MPKYQVEVQYEPINGNTITLDIFTVEADSEEEAQYRAYEAAVAGLGTAVNEV